MNRSLPFLLAAVLPFACSAVMAHPGHEAALAAATAPAPSKLAQSLRTLWQGHVEAVRAYVFAAHDHDAPKAKAAADRVVANARQIADAVGGFYGKPAGDRMMGLLAVHWGAVKAYADATFAKDEAVRGKAMADLNTNAKDIADFFSGANPYLPQATLMSLLAAHGAHHVGQIQQVAAGDKAGELRTWQAMQAHMVVIADALAGGIARQFPDKTKG